MSAKSQPGRPSGPSKRLTSDRYRLLLRYFELADKASGAPLRFDSQFHKQLASCGFADFSKFKSLSNSLSILSVVQDFVSRTAVAKKCAHVRARHLSLSCGVTARRFRTQSRSPL